MHAAPRAAGQVPQHPGIGGAEDSVAVFRGLAHPVNVLEDPLQLPSREIGRRRQARLAADHVAAAVSVQRRCDPVGAGVLPDDRVVIRSPGLAIPYQRRLTLVGYAEGGNIAWAKVGGVQH